MHEPETDIAKQVEQVIAERTAFSQAMQDDPHFRRLMTHMPATFDFTMVTLKGHLLLEEQLNNYVDGFMEKPHVLNSSRLQFDLKVKLAHALSGDLPNPAVWDALRVLNKIRNSLAHRLDDQNLNNLQAEFIRQVTAAGFEHARIDQEGEEVQYFGRIAYLVGLLVGATNPAPPSAFISRDNSGRANRESTNPA